MLVLPCFSTKTKRFSFTLKARIGGYTYVYVVYIQIIYTNYTSIHKFIYYVYIIDSSQRDLHMEDKYVPRVGILSTLANVTR